MYLKKYFLKKKVFTKRVAFLSHLLCKSPCSYNAFRYSVMLSSIHVDRDGLSNLSLQKTLIIFLLP